MNAHVVEHPAVIKAEISAFVKLARGQSRRAVGYHQWALEARRNGQPVAAERWEAVSRKSRDDAKWHLQKAIERKDRSYARP